MSLHSREPSGPLAEKWNKHRFEVKLVNPANKRKFKVIVVGSGLAGASAAATLGEQGYNVSASAIQDSPRRAHSVAAQGGINAAKNYRNDGDSIYRLFYDTVKGGDFRARESNVYRLAEVSNNIIDQCVAQGVPFAREYGGHVGQPLLWRRAGVAHLLRPRPDRPATLAGRLFRRSTPDRRGHVKMYNRHRDARSGRDQRPARVASSRATW
jgi:succinate dehydrogenase / fumarate reductase flavoprotein subunit